MSPKELKIIKKLMGINYYCLGAYDMTFCPSCPFEVFADDCRELCKLISPQIPKFKKYEDFINWRDEE